MITTSDEILTIVKYLNALIEMDTNKDRNATNDTPDGLLHKSDEI
jgi:hypothetical protein